MTIRELYLSSPGQNKRKNKPVQKVLGLVASLLLISMTAGCETLSEWRGGKGLEVLSSPCPSDETLTTYCGFQNPEDLALTPDGSHLVMTGYGGLPPASQPGKLYLFNLATQRAFEPIITMADNTWGDPACTRDTAVFSPHGLSLVQRTDGHHELAITNHLPRETIELFELVKGRKGSWSLTWRGCVDAPTNRLFNDVTLTRSGRFYASSMYDADLKPEDFGPIALAASDTGSVWHWTGGTGDSAYEMLRGTNGSFPNGLDLSEDEATLYINYWISRKTVKYNLGTGQIEHTFEAGAPDNLTVIGDDIWVANHDHTLADTVKCPPELAQCLLPFTIHVLSGDDLSVKQKWSFNSEVFGVATVAIPSGDTVWLGTHHGDRIASFEK